MATFTSTGWSDGQTGPYQEVEQHLDWARDLALGAYDDAVGYIQAMSAILEDLEDLPKVKTVDSISISAPSDFNPPPKPETPDLSTEFPDPPAEPTIDDITTPSLSEKPIFDEDAPDVSSPGAPGAFTEEPPTSPSITTTFTFPDEPDSTLPAPPDFFDLNIPSAPDIDFTEFDLDLPAADDIAIPGLTFSWSETLYTDDLQDAVVAKLIEDLSGGTGLPVEIEEAIWNRARDREEQISIRAQEQLLRELPQRNWQLPTGAITARLGMILSEAQDKLSSINRDIAIKQAELELQNLRQTISDSIQMESSLLQHADNKAQRAFEAAKFIQEAAIDIFKARIQKYAAQIDGYKAYAAAFEAQIRAELAQVEIFKAQIEAEKLKADIDELKVRRYLGLIEGIKAKVDIYRTQVSAVEVRIRAEATKIENYKAQIQAFDSQVRAKIAEYELYSKKLEAALFPLNVYTEKVKAFTSRVQAYAAEASAEKVRVDAEVAGEQLKIERYDSTVKGFLAQVEAIAASYKANVDVFDAAARMYAADIGAEESRYRSQTAFVQAEADIAIKNGEVQIANANLAINRSLNAIKIAGDILDAQSRIAAQLSAAALSGISIGAQIAGQDQFQETHYYDETA